MTMSSSARPASRWGSSSRSQFCINTTPGTRASSAGRQLGTSRLHEGGSTEHAAEVVILPEHRDRDARGLETKQQRLAIVTAVDVDERGVPARLRALDQ